MCWRLTVISYGSQTWCNNRGPDAPSLLVRIDDLTPKQIREIRQLQEIPSPDSDFSSRPYVLRISDNKLQLCAESAAPPNNTSAQPSNDTESTLTAEESDSVETEQPPAFSSEIPLPAPSIAESWFSSGFIGNVTESPPTDYLDPSYCPTDLSTNPSFR